MPITWGNGLPPDDPIFSRGLISVFANVPLEASDDPPVEEDDSSTGSPSESEGE